jgi:hypothetical protein
MKFVNVLVASLLAINLPLTAAADAQASVGAVSRADAAPAPRSALLAADCKETAVMPVSLPPRPAVRRATFASKPTHHARPAHKRHKPAVKKRAIGKHKATKHKATKHRPKHRRHPAAHRPGPASLRVHRVTYASPLCDQRSSVMNTMLGLDDYAITQPPEAAMAPGIDDAVLNAPDLFGYTGGGGGGTGSPTGPIVIFPGGPTFPTGPTGPIIILPPVGPVGPVGPVTPPTTPSAVPEPNSWATMMIGMMLVGGAVRRRQRSSAKTA